jgi:hypothetical protein
MPTKRTQRSDAEVFVDARKRSTSVQRFRRVCTFMWTVDR